MRRVLDYLARRAAALEALLSVVLIAAGTAAVWSLPGAAIVTGGLLLALGLVRRWTP